MFGVAFAFFKIQNALTKGGIRPTAEVEEEGLDLPEMGVLAYPEFVGSHVELNGDGEPAEPHRTRPLTVDR
jgi:Amt family ammonium transporter